MKTLIITSLSTLAISCLMLILAVFKLPIFQGVWLRLLLIISTISVSTALANNEIVVIKRKKILGYVGLALLCVSMLFAFIVFCSPLFVTANVFNRITGVVSLISVLFILIISINTKLGKKFIGLQAPTFIAMSGTVLMIALIVCGVKIFDIKGILEMFIILCILSVGLFVASSIVSGKNKEEIVDESEEKIKNQTITISLVEYNKMKETINALTKENENLRKNSVK